MGCGVLFHIFMEFLVTIGEAKDIVLYIFARKTLIWNILLFVGHVDKFVILVVNSGVLDA